jgi:hypothetical protein
MVHLERHHSLLDSNIDFSGLILKVKYYDHDNRIIAFASAIFRLKTLPAAQKSLAPAN